MLITQRPTVPNVWKIEIDPDMPDLNVGTSLLVTGKVLTLANPPTGWAEICFKDEATNGHVVEIRVSQRSVEVCFFHLVRYEEMRIQMGRIVDSINNWCRQLAEA